jgi:hypothetical protein
VIDAYEIGIELLLQDGVSAGLETIARELAAVDAAVAASSAGLMALTRLAEGVSSGATSMGVVGGAPGKGVEPKGADAAAPVVDEAPDGPRLPREAVGDLVAGMTAAPVARRAVDGAVVAEPITVRALTEGTGRPERASAPRPAVSLAEVAGAAPVTPVGLALAEAAALAGGAGHAPIVAAPSSAPVGFPAASAAARVAAVAPAQQSADPAMPVGAAASAGAAAAPLMVFRDALPALKADVGAVSNAPAPVAAAMQRQARPGPAPDVRVESDWSGGAVPTPGPVSMAAGGAGGRPAASPRREAGRSEGGDRPVLLDGRLVGQWLGERMARDAARPGAGTTFFDPRQAPAWTPSGAL